jgi:hypothetical protein
MANQQRAPRKVSSLHRRVKDFLGFLDPASVGSSPTCGAISFRKCKATS